VSFRVSQERYYALQNRGLDGQKVTNALLDSFVQLL
jgi:hypothetical protein